MSNKKSESKTRFNVIDFIIIILVIGCVVGIVLRYNYVQNLLSTGGGVSAQVKFTADISKTTSEGVSVGDVYYIVSNNLEFGKLTSCEFNETYTYEESESGLLVKTLDETKVTLTGIITVSGRDTSNGFMLGGTYFISPGQSFEIIGKNARFTVTLTSLKVV